MDDIRITVPTYHNSWQPKEVEAGLVEEYGPPEVPILIRDEEGVRIILGTHDHGDMHQPNVLIERQPNGWMIFLHPDEGDPSGYIYCRDDGRTFVQPEWGSQSIEWIDHGDPVPGFRPE